ncbi:MAG: geranylgeranylglycerol-phosphate geranylgeranyltransferase [Candidatus Diapherotrites archaeon]
MGTMSLNAEAILGLLRPWNCAMAAIAVFIGFAVAAGGVNFTQALVPALVSAFLICGAGHAINDYYDAEIDGRISPKKPVPSGRVSKAGARNLALALFTAGIAVSLAVNISAFAIAAVYSALLFAYSAWMRNYKFAGNWVVAAGTALTLVYGATITGNYAAVAYLALCALLANAAREIIKDMQDLGKDKGVKRTLPMLLPRAAVIATVLLLYCLSLALAFFVWAGGMLHGALYPPLMAVAAIAFCISSYRVVNGKFADAQRWSKYAMGIALLAFLGGVM